MKKFVLFLSSIPLLLFARKGEFEPSSLAPSKNGPWFTGPIIAPSGHVIPLGHQNIEPYVYWNRNTGNYNKHWKFISSPVFTNVATQVPIQIGVLPRMEFDFAPTFSYNNNLKQHTWVFNDLPITIAYQLYQDDPETWYPAVKLRFSFNLPIGKYDRLNPEKFLTDFGGLGSWYPGLGLVFSRVVNVFDNHYLAWRFFLSYTLGGSASVHGLNIYGGAPTIGPIQGTRGTVYPGDTFLVVQGLEFSLTQNWVAALDIQYQHANRRKFSGYSFPGTEPTFPSYEQISIAPAIEYNWSANVGIIVGPWFTITGRSYLAFSNWVVALNIYH